MQYTEVEVIDIIGRKSMTFDSLHFANVDFFQIVVSKCRKSRQLYGFLSDKWKGEVVNISAVIYILLNAIYVHTLYAFWSFEWNIDEIDWEKNSDETQTCQ